MLGGRRRIEITVSLPSGSVVSELFRLRQKWRALVQCGAGAFLACATHLHPGMWAVALEKALPRPSRVRQWVGRACPSPPTPFTGPHRPPTPGPTLPGPILSPMRHFTRVAFSAPPTYLPPHKASRTPQSPRSPHSLVWQTQAHTHNLKPPDSCVIPGAFRFSMNERSPGLLPKTGGSIIGNRYTPAGMQKAPGADFPLVAGDTPHRFCRPESYVPDACSPSPCPRNATAYMTTAVKRGSLFRQKKIGRAHV